MILSVTLGLHLEVKYGRIIEIFGLFILQHQITCVISFTYLGLNESQPLSICLTPRWPNKIHMGLIYGLTK